MEALSDSWTRSVVHQGRVSIGTHSLFLSTAGPPRNFGQPVVVVEAGYGNCSTAWPAAVRAISSFMRIYTYDRAGYEQSDPSPSRPTAVNIATELSKLLEAAGVPGPYILVGHSYGCVMIREFFELRKEDCVGLVLVDAVQEDDFTYEWPFKARDAMLGSLDRFEITGLAEGTHLTPEEWKAFVCSERKLPSDRSRAEYSEVLESVQILASKKQYERCALQSRPVSVIRGDHERDWETVYDAGVIAGNGTMEQREAMRDFLDDISETWDRNQEKQLRLSRNGRMVFANESGHQVQQEQPDILAEEVKWILKCCGK
jgi:pimeloyl-ACP methyl ester carboxylesterase